MKIKSYLCVCFSFFFSLLLSVQPAQAEKKEAKDVVALQVGAKNLTLKDVLATQKEKKLKVYVADAKKEMEFVGFDLKDILDSQLGKDWQKADGILVTALDGYKSDVSVKKILKYRPLLAYRFADNKKFTIDNPAQNEKNIDLGPYILIWDNLKHAELKRAGAYDWPYQVASMATIQYAEHYAKAFPIKNANGKVTAGFEAFKAYCMNCHAVGGEGGEKGPALWIYPKLFTGGEKQFTKWVLDPSSVKAGTTMPALNTELTSSERKDLAEKIYSYLEALHKIKPSQQP